MKLLVFEYITGGGLYPDSVDNQLLREAMLMRDSLLSELALLDGLDVSVLVDTRVPRPEYGRACLVDADTEIWAYWRQCMQDAEAVWLIAPESKDILFLLTEMAESLGKKVLGCSSASVKLTSSKLATFKHLAALGIPTVPTYHAVEWLQRANDEMQEWVIKPDDGVGCEHTRWFMNVQDVKQALQVLDQASYVVQPKRAGVAASLSLLCYKGHGKLLACNRQMIDDSDFRFCYQGSEVNALQQYDEAFDELAQSIAAAIPTLHGYVGVDLILNETVPERSEVLEINPRLTTSYAGLHQALGMNVARMVLEIIHGGAIPAVVGRQDGCREPVRITL